MRCSSCGADNPLGLKFCDQCAAPLRRNCASCGFENTPTARFCGDCGASLILIETPIVPEISPDAVPDGERRHLRVLFCDLVNSTAIAARLDPEEWRDIAADYQRSAAEAVTRLGGHVAKYLGDGLIVYFGYPAANEDDAERAVRAGLAIVDAVAALNQRLAAAQNVKLAVRVGIHAGPVVVGRGGGKEPDVFGDAPNVAERVQTVAAPDSVFITAAVHQLVSGLFVVEDRGLHPLKGVAQPLQLYQVIQPSAVRRRRHGAAARWVTPFVGRDEEMRLLLSRWTRAREGDGQLALIIGEPGIGKSRLVEEFRARIKDEPHLWIECAGEQFFESTPFHAVTQMLDQGLGWRGDETEAERVIQLERSLELSGMKLGEAVPLIAEMLNLKIPDKYPPLLFAPDQKRKRLLANLAMWVLNATRLQPTVIAMEDLQWVDPSTLELTQMLVEQSATARLMLLYTGRPEFRSQWPIHGHHAQITLNRLNDRQTREMVANVSARAALATDVVDTVVRRADGVPLYAEELTRLMLEGDGRSIAREIPATLLDSLTARLDRLGPAREVAQVAAVIGREFSYELLHAVSPAPEQDLQTALTRLIDAELIYTRGVPPEASYQFKHALIQDAAYEALLKSRRRELHRLVARTITGKFATLAAVQPQVLARHWTGAGEAELAIAAWQKAGFAADARRAFKEAEEDFRQALAILKTLPESPERDASEQAIMNGLCRVLILTLGYPAAETVQATARAHALAQKSGDLNLLIAHEIATWGGLLVSGDQRGATALAEQMFGLAQLEGSDANLEYAHNAQVHMRYYRGDFAGVADHFARMSRYLDATRLRLSFGTSNAEGFAGLAAWAAGHADAARQHVTHAVASAIDAHNLYDQSFARYFEAWVYRWLRDPVRAEAAARQSLTIAEELGFQPVYHLARPFIGWARANLGDTGLGLSLIRQGMSGLIASGAKVGICEILTLLAEAQALDGSPNEALGTIEDALEANPEELVFQPNILTCRGELRLRLGQAEPAEADFREAIALAQKMNAKALELRAATSLARILAKQGRRADARATLAPIHAWFTEGLDTLDLKDAQNLLDSLGS